MSVRPVKSRRVAVSLVELIVVLAIIAVLLGLLFPALIASRERARQGNCLGHLHQLDIAMQRYFEVHRKLPDPCPPDAIGGWAIAILPYMEESNLADGLSGNPPIDPSAPSALARLRPPILTCPSAYEGESNIATVPASHYTAFLFRNRNVRRNKWHIGDMATDSRIPWVASPELNPPGPADGGPHSGGYNLLLGYPLGHGPPWLRWEEGR